MKELIETLNHCSGGRCFFYCIIGLMALYIVGLILTDVVGSISRIFINLRNKKNKDKI